MIVQPSSYTTDGFHAAHSPREVYVIMLYRIKGDDRHQHDAENDAA